jgi:YfiH family protein
MSPEKDNTYRIFEAFQGLGFIAGITLRGPWEDQVDVYKYIRRNILPPGYRMIAPYQVHGRHIEVISRANTPVEFDADGTITAMGDTCLTVSTADCLPLLMADPESGLFAAVHIGWRSFVAGIIENLFQIACDSGLDSKTARVFLGPSIGSCCFEVGPEVAELFESAYIVERDGLQYADLREAVANKLIAHDVSIRNIGGITDCTSCESGRYYSYRRDKKSPVQLVTFIYRSVG